MQGTEFTCMTCDDLQRLYYKTPFGCHVRACNPETNIHKQIAEIMHTSTLPISHATSFEMWKTRSWKLQSQDCVKHQKTC